MHNALNYKNSISSKTRIWFLRRPFFIIIYAPVALSLIFCMIIRFFTQIIETKNKSMGFIANWPLNSNDFNSLNAIVKPNDLTFSLLSNIATELTTLIFFLIAITTLPFASLRTNLNIGFTLLRCLALEAFCVFALVGVHYQNAPVILALNTRFLILSVLFKQVCIIYGSMLVNYLILGEMVNIFRKRRYDKRRIKSRNVSAK